MNELQSLVFLLLVEERTCTATLCNESVYFVDRNYSNEWRSLVDGVIDYLGEFGRCPHGRDVFRAVYLEGFSETLRLNYGIGMTSRYRKNIEEPVSGNKQMSR